MSKLILVAFSVAAVLTAASSANAGRGDSCDEWGCGLNGTQTTGVALPSASTGTVNSVILPSGETVELR